MLLFSQTTFMQGVIFQYLGDVTVLNRIIKTFTYNLSNSFRSGDQPIIRF